MGTRQSTGQGAEAYPLTMLLTLREHTLEPQERAWREASQALREATAKQTQAEGKLQQAQEALRQAQAVRAQAQAHPFTIASQRERAEGEAALREALESARIAVREATEQVSLATRLEDTARSNMMEARRQAEVIRKHRAQWEAGQRDAALRAEETEQEAFLHHRHIGAASASRQSDGQDDNA